MASIRFKGTGKRLTDADITHAGKMVGTGEDEIHAVLDVESCGRGFDAQGRLKMLFEPHVFYRNLSGAQRNTAVAAGLAYSTWRAVYPTDSYPRLMRAIEINETAALKSASWGLGQILGENHAICGYVAPQSMVKDALISEGVQLQQMIRFIKAKKLDAALRKHDWHAFARGYNGAGYAKNNYHVKLATAFAKWQRIKDTPLAEASKEDVKEIEKQATRDLTKKERAARNGAVVVGGATAGAEVGNQTGTIKTDAVPPSSVNFVAIGVAAAVVLLTGFLIWRTAKRVRAYIRGETK